jgi:hypothetical protein
MTRHNDFNYVRYKFILRIINNNLMNPLDYNVFIIYWISNGLQQSSAPAEAILTVQADVLRI